MEKLKSFIKIFIGWPLTLVALFSIFRTFAPDFFSVSQTLTNINYVLLFLGILSLICYFFVRSVFWKKLLALKGHPLSLKEISYYWGFTEIKRYIPGNIWSLISRADMLSEKQVPVKTTITATLIEAEFITVASLILSLLSLNFIVYGLLPNFPNKNTLVVIITFIIILLTCVFIANRSIFKTPSLQHALKIKKFTLKISLEDLLPAFSIQDNFYLLVTKTAAMFFFGLGTYFIISSFHLLYLPYILTLIGFFVFSLLVGYISFITPMGLGVREGVMTYGLSKFIALSLAGFAAIFARIIFVISELLFLLITYLWHKHLGRRIQNIESFIITHRYGLLLGIVMCLYILYFTTATFLKYDNFFTGRFDLGNMDQTVWNTLHGRIFQATDPNGTDIISRLAFHADFILVLLAPLYFFWQDPKNLLLIQTIVLACGAIFIYLIGKYITKQNSLAFFFACLYLLNPAVQYTNLYDFHGVSLGTTFLLGAFYFLKTKRYVWYSIFLLLSGLTKEEIWIITALLGLYTALWEKKRVLGMSIFISSLAVFFFLVGYAIPHANGGAHFAFSYYSDFGSSPKEIFRNLLFHPNKTISLFFQKDRIEFVFELLFPLGFFSLFAPLMLIFILPELAADLLSTNTNPHTIYYQYTASLTPFIFIAALYGWRKLQTIRSKLRIFKTWNLKIDSYIQVYLLIMTILASYFYGPLPGAKAPALDMFTRPLAYSTIVDNFLDTIPRNFSVASTNNLGSHLSRRQKIFTIPVGIDKADIILFLLNDPFAQPSLAQQKQIVEKMKHDQKYIEVFKLNDFIVFEKRDLYVHREPVVNRVKLFPVSIPSLQNRDFVGGIITYQKQVEVNDQFTSYIVTYPSDGLTITALLNIPHDHIPTKGFPIVIVNHDTLGRETYNTITTDKNITDYFASHGFAVIKPDFRGNGSSEDDSTLPHNLAYPVDELNLISSLSTLKQINPQEVFLWGQSIGGTVTLTTIAAHDQNRNFTHPLKGAAVWSPITDPYRAYVQSLTGTTTGRIPYTKTVQLLGTPQKNPLLWQSLSPLFYIDDMKTPIAINQGILDITTPYQWSIELYDDLLSLNKPASLSLYPNEDHTFSHTDDRVLEDDVKFFNKLLGK